MEYERCAKNSAEIVLSEINVRGRVQGRFRFTYVVYETVEGCEMFEKPMGVLCSAPSSVPGDRWVLQA